MNISTATQIIDNAYRAGSIDLETWARAQRQIRETSYYGNQMTARDRARIVNIRFGLSA